MGTSVIKRKGTWGKAPVMALALVSMLGLSACRVDGDTHVRAEVVLKNKDGRFKHLAPGVYKTSAAYDKSDKNPMTLQEFIKFEEDIRCICIGRDRILASQYDPTRVGPTGLMGCYGEHE